MNRKINIIVFLVVIAGIYWTSCDKIEEPLVIVNEQDIPLNIDTNLIDSVIVTEKQVLLEEFTGHKCVNCPEAAFYAHDVAEENDHRVIICTLQAGYQAIPAGTGAYTTDFNTIPGTAIFNSYGGDAAVFPPAATINRYADNNGQQIFNYFTGGGAWGTIIPDELAKESVLNLKLINNFDPETNNIYISVTSTFTQQLDGIYKVVVYIVEDNITAPQKNGNNDLPGAPEDGIDWLDYIHRNVLRDAISAVDGLNISDDGTITEGENYTQNFYYNINQEWVTANCKIIAFIYNEESQEILQVAELGIKTEE